MDTIIIISFFVLSFFLLSSSFLHSSLSAFSAELPRSETEALQVINTQGGDAPCPSPNTDDPPPGNCGCTRRPPPSPNTDDPPLGNYRCTCPPPPPPSLSSRLLKARVVLLQFAATIDDPTNFTQNWIEGVSPCDYKGVRCDKFPDSDDLAVSGLDFNQAGFSAREGSRLDLTPILGIPELTFFHVNSNNFTGSVPKEITKYSFFFELDLSNNKLEGYFPWQVLFAEQLIFLDLRFNSLTGPVPPSLFFLDLDVIFINNNFFFGYLPWNFGFTPARYLTFANNKFIGPIPRSIGLASKTLTEVLFLGNQFSGCLPFEIGFLKNAVVFDVSKNWLTGPIPESFACLEKIRFLNLANNRFYGAVPESVCKLPGIQNDGNFSLAGNYFTEVGPECRKLIKSKVLDVSQNCIKDLPNQKSREECKKFLSCIKPCPNAWSLSYVPCKKYHSKYVDKAYSPPAPITYEALKPIRHRLM